MNQISPKQARIIWLVFHLSVPLLLLLSVFFIGPVRINTQLFDMLPKPNQSREVMKADTVLGERNSREALIFAAADDFQKAKNGAALLYDTFLNSNDYEKILLYFNNEIMREFTDYIYRNRYTIAGEKTLELLENGGAAEIARDALASAFGAFNFIPLANLDSDPFLLTERRMEELVSSSFFSGGGLSLKDDVPAVDKDGTWYILLRITLSPRSVSLKADQNAVRKIYAAVSDIKANNPGLEFYFSGIPFHSYESSSGAQKEISLISAITLIIIVIMFLYAFRSPAPVIFSVAAAGISIGLAAGAALLVFREIHIITFVFGTTLIGTCVDYSIHFFVHWKGNRSLKTGAEIRGSIFKSITMSFVSTEICFFVFLLAPFPILKQFAVFSMTGLLSSFLTSMCIYPYIKIPKEEKRIFKILSSGLSQKLKNISLPRFTGQIIVITFSVAAVVFLLFRSSDVKIENDISSLYTMSPAMLESEKRTAMVMNYGSPGWYFIVAGASGEETLQREEQLALRLQDEISRGNLSSFLGTSLIVPSIQKQKKNHKLMETLLPLAASQFEYLGFPPEYTAAFNEDFARENYCLPRDAPFITGIDNLWIGEKNSGYYSCVIPLNPGDETIFRSIAAEFDFVYFVNKAKDIGSDLDTLTKTMLLFFLAAYIAVSVIICIVYSRKESVKICAVPILLTIAVLCALAANKIPVGFFSSAALILVFGLGLDYIFYMTDKKRDDGSLTSLGVFLSFATTLLSFGALALSNFAPVHIFGLCVSAGLGAAFISAMLLQSKVKSENQRKVGGV